jgi:hypothetical protein
MWKYENIYFKLLCMFTDFITFYFDLNLDPVYILSDFWKCTILYKIRQLLFKNLNVIFNVSTF